MTAAPARDAAAVPSPPAGRRPLLIGSEIYRHSTYGERHPLAIPRVSTAIDMVRALGWLPDEAYLDSPVATPAELARFHRHDYIDALRRAEATRRVSAAERERYDIGRNGNPVFAEIFRRPATACGASLLAARMLAAGRADVVYSPAGGTHHGRPDRASGFCYFNDPVLAILEMLDRGLGAIAYVDLDAHHGDGVQDAFAEDDRVLTISIHEDGRWPRTGPVDDRAGGQARNLPVPPGLNDSELEWLVEGAVLPLLDAFAPEALVIQGGSDALADDPQSGLMLSNGALWAAVARLRRAAPRVLVTGGGGYNPWAVGRCWAGIWAVLDGHSVPPVLPPPAEAVLRALRWNHSRGRQPPETWFTTLADPPRPGAVRDEIRHIARRVLMP